MSFPTSPDGKYHYLLTYQEAGGKNVGYLSFSTISPILAGEYFVMNQIRKGIAEELALNPNDIIITGLTPLAAP